MNDWYEYMYHDPKGRILGSISDYNGKYKAMLDTMFIGWFISEEFAKKAVEEAYNDRMKVKV